jgi:hypothetical protein
MCNRYRNMMPREYTRQLAKALRDLGSNKPEQKGMWPSYYGPVVRIQDGECPRWTFCADDTFS